MMNQDSEVCTCPNAEAVWNITPSVMAPAKKRGATTMWETWEFSDDTYSHNHGMFGSVSEWLFAWVAGIQPGPAAFGSDRIVFRPQPERHNIWELAVHAAYWHDTGHGQTRQNLGFISVAHWLDRLSDHIAGFHLHGSSLRDSIPLAPERCLPGSPRIPPATSVYL